MSDNVCNLSAGDVELLVEGERVGPWLFNGESVYVEVDAAEVEKLPLVESEKCD